MRWPNRVDLSRDRRSISRDGSGRPVPEREERLGSDGEAPGSGRRFSVLPWPTDSLPWICSSPDWWAAQAIASGCAARWSPVRHHAAGPVGRPSAPLLPPWPRDHVRHRGRNRRGVGLLRPRRGVGCSPPVDSPRRYRRADRADGAFGRRLAAVGAADRGTRPLPRRPGGSRATRGRGGRPGRRLPPRDGDGTAPLRDGLHRAPLRGAIGDGRRLPADGFVRGFLAMAAFGRERFPPGSCSAKWCGGGTAPARGAGEGRRRPTRRRRGDVRRARVSPVSGNTAMAGLRALSPRGAGGIRDPGDDRRDGDDLLLPGCRSIHGILRSEGLTDFYARRHGWTPGPPESARVSARRVRRGRRASGRQARPISSSPDPLRLLRLAHRAVPGEDDRHPLRPRQFRNRQARISWNPSEPPSETSSWRSARSGTRRTPRIAPPAESPFDGKRRTCCCASGPRRSSRCR